jgi:hypothetical protein
MRQAADEAELCWDDELLFCQSPKSLFWSKDDNDDDGDKKSTAKCKRGDEDEGMNQLVNRQHQEMVRRKSRR